jgi:hypothetical protein
MRAKDTKARIESKLLSALESGPATPMTARDWKPITTEGLERLRANKKVGESLTDDGPVKNSRHL